MQCGSVKYQCTGYDYTYYLGDNLGNTHITFGTKTGAAVTYQKDDYYAFGLEINRSVTNPKNEYLYNKKELQEELGQYDYGARFYDPVIARWTNVDPFAELGRRWSPYNYVLNNPIRFTDPDGMAVSYDAAGNVTYTGEDAVNFAKGIQAYTNKVVSIALGFAGIGGGKGGSSGSSSGPPKDGDRKGNLMYSEFSHGYVTEKVFYELKRVEARLAMAKEKEQHEIQAYTAYGQLLVDAGKGAAKGAAFYMGGELLFAWLGTVERVFQVLNPGKQGAVMGWGTGQTLQAAEQTEEITSNLTSSVIKGWQDQGVTREFVESMLQKYNNALADPRKAGNLLLEARKALFEKILKLWPK